MQDNKSAEMKKKLGYMKEHNVNNKENIIRDNRKIQCCKFTI